MNGKTRGLTLCAMFTAFCAAMLYLSSLSPTGQLGIVAFASVFIAAAVVECGVLYGVCVFIASSVIGALLLPVKGAFLMFLLFFGYYPIIKHLVEEKMGFIPQWILKLTVFNTALTLIWLLFRELVFGFTNVRAGFALVYLAANVVFLIYDYGYTKLVKFYIYRISDKIKRK